jgi:hypothetical protein
VSAAVTHGALSVALDMARVGYYLAPVTLQRGTDGKKRASYYGSWDEQSTRDPDKIRDWYVQHECSFLVDCGKSGIVGVDLDLKEDRDGIASWQAQGGPQGGIVVDTLSGGQHHYFAADPDRPLTNTVNPKTGVDVRGEGGHLYAPGTVILDVDGRPEAGAYAARGPLYTPGDLPPAPEILHQLRKATSPNAGLPREDRKFTLAEARAYCRTKLDELTAAGEGGRNHALNTAAYRLGHFIGDHFGTTYEAAEKALRKALPDGYGSVPGEKGEIAATIRSGLTDGIEDGVYVRDETEVGSAVDEEDPNARRERLIAERVERLEIDAEANYRLRELAGREIFVGSELHRLQVREEAQRHLRTENMPPLAVLDAEQFLQATMPEWLVRDFLYRASTAKVYGPPGGTKSFFLLDVALHLATGRRWQGRVLPRTHVHYVMAEGQAVNTLRTHGWLTHHDVDEAELKGWFTAIPQGVLLTPEGIESYLATVRAHQPGLIILDTKNRMMVGEENSASDVAVMIRAMDALREISGACICLVDHTGILDQTRGRGSNAVTAAMDSEIRVGVTDDVATAEVTRDKAGVTGEKVSYRLLTIEDVPTPADIRKPAVCDPVEVSTVVSNPAADEAWKEWRDPALWPLPLDVAELAAGGSGKTAIPDVARYMRHFASDQDAAGRARNEMCRDLLKLGTYRDDTVLRAAWDRLLLADRIWNIQTKSRTAATHWMARPGDPAKRSTPIEGTSGHGADREAS